MNRSIRGKMISRILPVILVFFTLSGAITYQLSKTQQTQLAYAEMQEGARRQASQFDAEMRTYQAYATMLATSMAQNQSGNRREVEETLHQVLGTNANILGAYVAFEPNAFDGQDSTYANQAGQDASGRFVPYWNKISGSEKLEPLMDYDTSAYYQLPKQKQAFQVIDPYLYNGTLMTSYVAPIMKDGQFTGIGGVDVSLADLNSRISQIHFFDSGYAFLVARDGTFVAYQDQEAIGTKKVADLAQEKNNPELTRLAAELAAGKEGSIETRDPLTGKPVAMFYTPVETGQWGMVTVAPLDEMLAGVTQLTMIIALVAIVGLLISAGAIFWIATALTRPLAALNLAVQRIATGDLDVQVEARGRDEIGQMTVGFGQMVAYLQEMAATARRVASGDLSAAPTPRSAQDALGNAFAQMVTSLQGLIGQVSDSAAQVMSASEQLAAGSEQAGSATGQVTMTIQQVAQGASSQADSTTQITVSVDAMRQRVAGIATGAATQANAVSGARQSVTQLNQSLAEVLQAAAAGANAAQQATQTAHTGAQTVQGAIRDIESIRDSSSLVGQRVSEMGRYSEEIGKIVSTIQDIADQTNLLALNAAIEAARAGEQGRGFAVVAEEVRKLAEKSGAASGEIAALIRRVQRGTEEAIAVAAQSGANVEQGVQDATAAGQALAAILTATDESNRAVANIQAAAAQIQQLAKQVTGALEVVATVGEQNATATQEMQTDIQEVGQAIESVAATAEENAASVEEVSATAEELSAQIEEVAASAQELAALANSLRDAVGAFTLQDSAVPASVAQPAPASREMTPLKARGATGLPQPPAQPCSPAAERVIVR